MGWVVRSRTFCVKLKIFIFSLFLMIGVASLQAAPAQAAACVESPVDYGIVTTQVSAPTDGTYRIWSHMLTPSTVANSYLLEIDGTTCAIVGGDGIAANTWTWVDYQDGDSSSKIDISLSAGTHTLRLIGAYPDVQIDRLLLTPELNCVPVGDGTNCGETITPGGVGSGAGSNSGELAPTGQNALAMIIVGAGLVALGLALLLYFMKKRRFARGLMAIAMLSGGLGCTAFTTFSPVAAGSPLAVFIEVDQGAVNDNIEIVEDSGIANEKAVKFTYTSQAPDRLSWGDLRQWTSDEYTVKDVATSGQAAHLNMIEWSFGKISPAGLCVEEEDFDLGAEPNYLEGYSAERAIDGVADKDNQPLAGAYNQIRKLKAKYPDMKAVLSVGGWGWSQYFSDIAETDASRQAFVESCVDLYLRGNLPEIDERGGEGAATGVFDAIDIDWEWPNYPADSNHVYRPEDKANYVALMAEFRSQMDALSTETGKDYELSFVLPNGDTALDPGFDMPGLFASADYAVVTGFDFAGGSPITMHSSNLNPTGGQWISNHNLVEAMVDAGAPAEKLVLATSAFAKGFTADSDADNGLYQNTTSQLGDIPYTEVLDVAGTRFYDPSAGAVWKYNPANNHFWTYDDPEVIAQKIDYIESQGLAGIEIWGLDGDNGSLVEAMGE